MNEHPSPLPWWRRSWALGALLAVVTLLAYQPAWHGEPIFDDEDHLTPPELSSVAGLGRIWIEVGVVSQYYPVFHSVLWLENRLWGEAMLGYHLTNILLHVLAALLLVGVLRRLQVPGAWLAGAIFALHPVQAESAAYISELKNTLSGVFYFGAALSYLTYDRTRERRAYAIALVLFVGGLLTKSVIASLPAALLVVFWWQRGRLSWRQDVRPLLPFFAASLAAGLLTVWVEKKFIGAEGTAFDLTMIERVLIAGRAFWFYLSKLAWPTDLILIYPRWHVSQAAAWQYVFPLAALLALAGTWTLRHRSRAPLAALLLFGGTLFPALGFLNVYPFVYSYVADHYQYHATAAVFALAAAGLAVLLIRREWWGRPAGHALCAALLGVLALLTWRQSRMYVSVETAWQTTLAKNPQAFAAHGNLGHHFLQQGRIDEAIHHCRTAVELQPEFAELRNNLANALLQKGLTDEALREYQKALELRPGLAAAHFNLGAVLLQQGRREEALPYFQKAVDLRPEFVKARNNLASVLLDLGRTDESIGHLEKALAVHPADPDALINLGNALTQKGRLDDAMVRYRRALEIVPDSAMAHYNLGTALLQKEQVDDAIAHLRKAAAAEPPISAAPASLARALLRKGANYEALAELQRAAKLQPADASVQNDLGNLLLQNGELAAATQHFRRALEIQPADPVARYNLGYTLVQQGQLPEAAAHFQTAAALPPGFAPAHYQLGSLALQEGRLAEAIARFQKALTLDPRDAHTHNDLGVALAQEGKTSDAIVHFRQALTLQPELAQAHTNLGKAFLHAGQPAEAVAQYRAALKLQPQDLDALTNLAWVLATSPDASLRNGLQALFLAQRANQRNEAGDTGIIQVLAAAYAECGRFEEAIHTAEMALQRAEAQSDSALAEALRHHLTLYRAGSPVRDDATTAATQGTSRE